MRKMLIWAAIGGLALYGPLGGTAQAATSIAGTAPNALTCRTALEGLDFVRVGTTSLAVTDCCMVLQESDWYRQNDIHLRDLFETYVPDAILTTSCFTPMAT